MATTEIGNLTRDPELKYLPSGMAVLNFSIAVNNRRKNKMGEYEDIASFIDVTAYGELAENVSESLGRGTRAIVVGHLEQRSWETKDGDKRSKVEIIADEISPSLRWAKAVVTKTEKKDSNGSSNGNARTRQPAGRPSPVATGAYDDEF